MESQVYFFYQNHKEFIIRINPDIEGFKKDNYAYNHFNSKDLPIPKIIKYGKYNNSFYYCISEKASGITYEDSSEETIVKLLPNITKILLNISDINISNTNGFGPFSSETGNGLYKTWKEFLLSSLEEHKDEWQKATKIKQVDEKLILEIKDYFLNLIKKCPEERVLIHGDFGSNNIIVNDNLSDFSAVIDWDCAGYGDFLYTVASAHFWSPWLICMKKTAEYWDNIFSTLPNYNDRIMCYQLHIGLNEILENALDKDFDTLDFCQNRCREILTLKKN